MSRLWKLSRLNVLKEIIGKKVTLLGSTIRNNGNESLYNNITIIPLKIFIPKIMLYSI
jgi:hypothetical protein